MDQALSGASHFSLVNLAQAIPVTDVDSEAGVLGFVQGHTEPGFEPW